MSKEFQLDRSDISIAGGGGHGGRRKARLSRSLASSDSHFTFTHKPTGVQVSGRVIPGYYSRKELSRLNQKLCDALYKKLEREVARKLRVSGQQALSDSHGNDDELFEIIVGEFSAARLPGKKTG
ncbi:MAG: hypothetical protein AB1631_21810 [Acidobacteriota bacterium]